MQSIHQCSQNIICHTCHDTPICLGCIQLHANHQIGQVEVFTPEAELAAKKLYETTMQLKQSISGAGEDHYNATTMQLWEQIKAKLFTKFTEIMHSDMHYISFIKAKESIEESFKLSAHIMGSITDAKKAGSYNQNEDNHFVDTISESFFNLLTSTSSIVESNEWLSNYKANINVNNMDKFSQCWLKDCIDEPQRDTDHEQNIYQLATAEEMKNDMLPQTREKCTKDKFTTLNDWPFTKFKEMIDQILASTDILTISNTDLSEREAQYLGEQVCLRKIENIKLTECTGIVFSLIEIPKLMQLYVKSVKISEIRKLLKGIKYIQQLYLESIKFDENAVLDMSRVDSIKIIKATIPKEYSLFIEFGEPKLLHFNSFKYEGAGGFAKLFSNLIKSQAHLAQLTDISIISSLLEEDLDAVIAVLSKCSSLVVLNLSNNKITPNLLRKLLVQIDICHKLRDVVLDYSVHRDVLEDVINYVTKHPRIDRFSLKGLFDSDIEQQIVHAELAIRSPQAVNKIEF